MTKDKESKDEIKKHLQSNFNQSTIIFIGKIVGLVITFLSNFVLAKFFGAKVLGRYSLTLTIINIVTIVNIFGFDNSLVKYLSREKSKNEMNYYIKIALFYSSIFGFLITIVIMLIRNYLSYNIFNDPELSIYIFWGSLLIIPITHFKILSGIYRAHRNMKYFIYSNNFYKKVIFILSILLIYNIDIIPDDYIVLALVIGQIYATFYLFIKLKKIDVDLKSIFTNKTRDMVDIKQKEFFIFSSRMILVSFLGVILSKIDRVMLGAMIGSESVGVYSLAATIAGLTAFFLNSSNVIFSSTISELFSQNKFDTLNQVYTNITKWIVALSLPIVINTILFSKYIMSFFGKEFLNGFIVLSFLSLGQFISVLVGGNGFILSMTGNEKLFMKDIAFMAVINIILNIIFINIWGLNGAAYATCISIIIFNLLKLIQVKKMYNIFPYSKNYYFMFYYLVGNLVMKKIIINIVPINIIIIVGIVMFDYLFLLLIMYRNKSEMDSQLLDNFILRIKKKIR